MTESILIENDHLPVDSSRKFSQETLSAPTNTIGHQAIWVRNAVKTYGSKNSRTPALINLNITVTQGTIYGLLGPSGCGKSTLLSCLVGRKRLDSGQIRVLGARPGEKDSGVPGKRVGYMPQELSLLKEFSIRETLVYFGWIYGMKTTKIEEKLRFLFKLLDLPSKNRLIKNLSGGQQRRVSFAVALLHEPELLILDEPTVGVDPLLRITIWNHLKDIVRESGRTVVITTHYIEEARDAHTIGLMRKGKLLAEEAPGSLMKKHGFSTLEEVFFKLSKNDVKDSKNLAIVQYQRKNDQEVIILGQESEDEENLNTYLFCVPAVASDGWSQEKTQQSIRKMSAPVPSGNGLKKKSYISTLTTKGKMKALLLKNFFNMWRNLSSMLFIYALPVAQVVLFCLSVGRVPVGLKIAVVNDEIPNWGAGGVCEPMLPCQYEMLSCYYLDHLNRNVIVQEDYATLEKAQEAVRRGETWGVLYFSNRTSYGMVYRAHEGRHNFLPDDESEIDIWLDHSNMFISVALAVEFHGAFQEFCTERHKQCTRVLQSPSNYTLSPLTPLLNFTNPIFGGGQLTFTDFMASGVMLLIVFFLAVALTSSALIRERTEGLFDRSIVAGVGAGEVLASHVVTQCITILGQTFLVVIFMIPVFGIACEGSIFLVTVLTILQGLCGMCFGFFISAVCEKEINSIELAVGSFFPSLLLGGVIWPIEGMPKWLRIVAQFLPLTMANASLRAILTRGHGFTIPEVYYGFITTIAWTVMFLIGTLVAFKVKRE